MLSEDLENEFQKQLTVVKKFLLSKDLLIFIFFLFVSASLWVLKALNKKYETMVFVPVYYVNKPDGYVITNELPESLYITLVGQGTNLIKCRWGGEFQLLPIDLSIIANGKRSISSQSLLNTLQKQVHSEIEITKIGPDSIIFEVERLAEKKIPIKVRGQYELAQQYCNIDTMTVNPTSVVAYGPQSTLDSMEFVATEETVVSDIKDSMIVKVKLCNIPLVFFSDSVINLGFKTERFTEKTIQAPISIANLPENRVLRIFPSNVSVQFKVALSHYERLDASSFSFFVDYDEAKTGVKKLKIQQKNPPSDAFGVKLDPDMIDYIIEEKSED